MWFGEITAVAGVMGTAVKHMAGPSMSQHVFKIGTRTGTGTGTAGKAVVFESMLAPTVSELVS